LNHKQWWCGLKLGRLSQARLIPLKGKDGRPFSFNLADPLLEFLHRADSELRGNLQTPEPVVNPQTKEQYLIRSLAEEAITSSQLEGANTTRRVGKEMIRRARAPRNRGERMILNNYVMLQHLLEMRDVDLTKEHILNINRIATEGTLEDAAGAGRFRRPDEPVVVGDTYGEVFHNPPPAQELDQRMEAMCDFANGVTPGEFVHPVLRSMILHFWLAYDHPFIDGNGRTARALFYWSMIRRGYWLCEFIPISRVILKAPAKYGTAFLYTETDDSDLTYFLLYHSEVLRQAIDDLHDYLDHRMRKLREAVAELKGLRSLNHRQRDLIHHALRHSGFLYTVRSHRSSHNVSYETARSDLMELTELGLLTKHKPGKGWEFRPVAGLHEKLKGSR
jgi:Fic family protein